MSDDAQQLVDAFLANLQMEETADYLARGRAFENLQPGELEDRWAAAFCEFAGGGDPRDQLFDDLGAEYRLRELDLPMGRVAAEMAALQERIEADYRRMKEGGVPGSIADDDRLRSFLRDLGRDRSDAN